MHFIPGLSSGRHIDCDYQIIDSLKLIYVSHNVAVSESESIFRDRKPKSKIEEIANLYGYEVREYPTYFADVPKGPQSISESLKRLKGINFILVNETLLTSSIHPDEKEYLKKRGLEAVVIPLGDVAPGAGLRCMYGEFNT